VIWQIRKSQCFEGVDSPDAVQVVTRAQKAIQAFHNASIIIDQHTIQLAIPLPNSDVRWRLWPPPAECYKFNKDAALNRQKNKWGLSAVI
jgi:hypothetical protein